MNKRYIARVADQSAVAPGSGSASGGAMTKLMACLLVIFGLSRGAHADVVYVWKTLSATIDGQPTSLTAAGEVTLTDAGFSQGFGSVTTTPPGLLPVDQTLSGVASASFQMFDGPNVATGTTDSVNFTAAVDGPYLAVGQSNTQYGFFVNSIDIDLYFANLASTGLPILTVGYGTDNSGSPCYGPQFPSQSHCVVTGVFERVVPEPEPASLPLSLAALGLFALIAGPRSTARTRLS